VVQLLGAGHIRYRQKQSSNIELAVMFAPTIYLLSVYGRLDSAINTGVFANGTILKLWLTLGASGYYLFWIGWNISSGIVFRGIRKRIIKIQDQTQLIEDQRKLIEDQAQLIKESMHLSKQAKKSKS
jgi:uncharacterized membrane protein (DUF106 family)